MSLAFLFLTSGCSSTAGKERQKELLMSSASECSASLSRMSSSTATHGDASAETTIKILNGSPKVGVITNNSIATLEDLDGTKIKIATSTRADNGVPKSAWIGCMREKGFAISDL